MKEFFPLKGYVDWSRSRPLAKWLHYKPYNTGHGDMEFFEPAVDVGHNDDSVVVRAEMPGLKAEDIDVELHDDHLYIRGTKKKEVEEKASLDQQERKFGVYHRRIPLEERVNPAETEAQYKDGVLVIVMGKNAPRDVKKIEVKSAS